MKKTLSIVAGGVFQFEQGSDNSSEFVKFAKDFKSEFKKELEKIGAKLHKFNVGHFYLSGFFTKGEKFYYFSWNNCDTQIMYRTAKNDKDYTGGSNQWVRINEDMAQQIQLVAKPNEVVI